VATWEDVWEELHTDIQHALAAERDESSEPATASLFPKTEASPHEKKLLKLIKPDESIHVDQLVEMLGAEMSSSEVFAALFELELNGKIRQLPGKNFVGSF
jgi:DNA processing protein